MPCGNFIDQAALVTSRFARKHPGVKIEVFNRSGQQIVNDLKEFTLDLGISYLNGENEFKIREMPLYTETLALLTPLNSPLAEKDRVTWKEAAEIPLVLLARNVQNREMIDRIFREQGTRVEPQIETNSLMNLAAHVRSGSWSSIVPRECFAFCSEPPGTCMVKLYSPEVTNVIGLQMRDREYPPVAAENFFKAAEELDIDSMFL